MNLCNLIITQQELRHPECIPQMAKYIRNGGTWNRVYLEDFAKRNNKRPSPLIKISKFQDDSLYLHDGHHRAVAVRMGGRKELYPEEYQVTNWTYEKYQEVNFSTNFVTPFDPRTRCRKADLYKFKAKIRDLFQIDPGYAEEAIWLVSCGVCLPEDLYWEPRKILSILALSKLYQESWRL